MEAIRKDFGLYPQVKEMNLWHGTRYTKLTDIYEPTEGLDPQYGNPGMWGRGVYFAVNASYSMPSYSHQNEDGTYSFFLMKVLIGDYIEL